MRLSEEKARFLVAKIKSIAPDAQIFLFGSRVDDNAKGGDIDLCILTGEKIPGKLISKSRIDFFKTFGFQKLDMINYTTNNNSIFRQIFLSEAIKLG
jgi:predicted nucleotidyltransferase